LSTLAAKTLGDAHALDQGKPLATLATRAAARIAHTETEPEESADSIREIWAGVGVLVGGAVTSVALVLNLPAAVNNATGRMLNALRESGEPVYLTLRQLVRSAPAWQCRDQTIFICENPAVPAEAAELLGPHCAPLICTQGQPHAAADILLRQLAAAGARLRYHGDFDWPGIHIGNGVMRRFAARPWRFDAAAYHAAERHGQPLRGIPVAASWDNELMPAMQACNRQVEEELVLDQLLADLAPG
jgi:uncharacterized protein (TIGR02679 family)